MVAAIADEYPSVLFGVEEWNRILGDYGSTGPVFHAIVGDLIRMQASVGEVHIAGPWRDPTPAEQSSRIRALFPDVLGEAA